LDRKTLIPDRAVTTSPAAIGALCQAPFASKPVVPRQCQPVALKTRRRSWRRNSIPVSLSSRESRGKQPSWGARGDIHLDGSTRY
jgi:hypothetical protein